MTDEPKVWIRARKLKSGKQSYHLRWIDPHAGKWRSRKVGTDKKRADREAATLEGELRAGTHVDIQAIAWVDFVAKHISKIAGKCDAGEAKRTLDEFGEMCKPASPRRVSFGMIESYVETLKAKKRPNTVATINKKLRYLRGAFNKAIKRGYLAKSPMDGWTWAKQKRKRKRIVQPDEEARLIKAAEDRYGFRMAALIRFALETWGRLSEVTGLRWEDVDLSGAAVTFRDTKSHTDRRVPIECNPTVLDDLGQLRLQIETAHEGGPFAIYADRHNLHKRWAQIIEDASIEALDQATCKACAGSGRHDVAGTASDCKHCEGTGQRGKTITFHDLRRTGISRALLDGVPPIVVQQVAGHADIKTTMEYYAEVYDGDVRSAMKRRSRKVG